LISAICAGVIAAWATGAQGSSGETTEVAPTLELYALEATLASTRARATELGRQQVQLVAEQASARRGLRAATAAMRASQATLARLVRELYVAGEADPIAILLGSGSIDEAVTGIDSLRRTASQSRTVREQATAARRVVGAQARALALRAREVARLEAEARAQAATLATALARRRAALAELRRREGLARAAAAQHAAQAAQWRSASLTAAAQAPAALTSAPSPPIAAAEPEAVRGRSLTVDAVAYSLPGHTASGLPVGHGVVAVDPAVIPLGTRLIVPGYGAAIAADVGSAVRGLVIDLWFPTLAEAQAWGRRTVTISFP
jgi:3D (Asp-Asp-Asp) domain-containing protein